MKTNQDPDDDFEGEEPLLEAAAPKKKTDSIGIPAAARPAKPGSTRGREDKTLIIPHGGGVGEGDVATESLDVQDEEDEKSAPTTGAAPGETEEVLVILPEDEAAGQLPVVETVVVEDDASWGAGPTEVLKDVPADLGAGQHPVSLEDVPLLQTNPVSVAARKTERFAATGARGRGEEETGPDDDIKVIDEIADIAADLEQEEPPDREPPRPLSPDPLAGGGEVGSVRPVGSRRIRVLAGVCGLAALILVGIFFFPDLERLFRRSTGGGTGAVTGSGQVHALGNATGTQQPGPTRPGQDALGELRARIHLAMQLGLRADAGKD